MNPTYQYGYDAQGNQTSLTSPNGGQTTFTFDAQGNQTARTLALGQTETIQYDNKNRETLAVSFEGAVTQFVYDSVTGNLTHKLLYPSLTAYNSGQGTPAESVAYKYDAFGRVVEVDDIMGSGLNAVTSVTTTIYDSQGNVLAVTSPQGTVSYAYDNLGRLVKTMTGQGPTLASETDYGSDALGRLATVTVVEQNGVVLGTPQTTNDEHDLQGNLIEEDLPDGVVNYFQYNNLNQLTKGTQNGAGNAPIAEYDYTYRPDGRQATATEDFWFTNNGQNVEVTNTVAYSYDALNRLIDEDFVTNADALLGLDPGLPSDVRQWESFSDQYTYDLDSNQVAKTIEVAGHQTPDETITSSYDTNDRILQQVDTTASGSTTTNFSYNNTEQTGQSVYSGTPSALGAIQSSQQYQYDLQGRTSGVTITSYTSGTASRVEQLTYGYDDSGIRVSALDQVSNAANGIWNAQTLTEYLNDPNNFTGYSQVVRETQSDPTTGQVQLVVEYVIGPSQISQTTTVYANGQPGTPSTLEFGYDGHGSVRVLLNTAGAIATVAGVRQLFNYDAYGNAIGFEIALAATILLYSGQQTDAATGLQYLRARYYNPNTDTFTTLDAYAGDAISPLSYNKYLYAQDDPSSGDDPSGLKVYIAARKLDATGLGWNNHVFVICEPDNPADFTRAATEFGGLQDWSTGPSATAPGPFKGLIDLYGGHMGVTLGGFDEGGDLVCEVNQQADVAADRESNDKTRFLADPSHYKSGWKLDYHEVTPPTGMTDSQFIKRLLGLSWNYQINSLSWHITFKAGGLWENERNCTAWAHTLLRKAGVPKTTIAPLMDFRGWDWGKAATIDSTMFDFPVSAIPLIPF